MNVSNFINLCVYLISCIDEKSPELLNCPDHCICYNAPPPISFNDDDQYSNETRKLTNYSFD